MVETPLRRSRRIRSQSEDESSLPGASTTSTRLCASRSRTSSAATSPASTPTRRSSRAIRTPRTAKGGKSAANKDLNTIPESIDVAADDGKVDDAVVATPAKSSKKRKKKTDSITAKPKGETDETFKLQVGAPGSNTIEEKDLKAKGGDEKEHYPAQNHSQVSVQIILEDRETGVIKGDTPSAAFTPAKSGKKKKKQNATPTDSSATVQGAEATAEAKVATSPKAPASTKRSNKKKKKRNPQSMEPEEASKGSTSPTKAPDKSFAGDGGVDTLAATPVKSAKKKTNQNATNKDSSAGKEGNAEARAPDSTKSSKKKTKKPKDSSSRVQGKGTANAEGATSPQAPSSTKSSATKKKRNAQSMELEEEPKVSAPTAKVADELSKTKEHVSGKVVGNRGADTLSATPAKSVKKKKNQNTTETNSNVTMQGEQSIVEATGADSPQAPVSTKCSKRKSKSKKKRIKTTKKNKNRATVQNKESTAEAKGAASPQAPVSTPRSVRRKNKGKKRPKVSTSIKAADVSSKTKTDGGVDTLTATPTKSTTKNEDSATVQNKESTAGAKGAASPQAPVSTTRSRKRKKKGNAQPMESKGAYKAPNSTAKTPVENTKKNENGAMISMDHEEVNASSEINHKLGSASSGPQLVEQPLTKKCKLSKNAYKRLRRMEEAKENTTKASSPPAQARNEMSKKKKLGEKAKGSEVSDSAGGTSSIIHNATPPTETSQTSKHADKSPEATQTSRTASQTEISKNVKQADNSSKTNQTSKKNPRKTKTGDKPPSKKQVPHKKKQSHKHKAPNKTGSKSLSRDSSKVLHHIPSEISKPVVDVKVHRLRFLKLHQNSVMAMSSTLLDSYTGNSDQHQHRPSRLAISREGGAVELISPQDRWVSIGHVPGVRGREVDALVWVSGRREDMSSESEAVESSSMGPQQCRDMRLVDEQRHLFGCSRDGTIFELDFATKRQKGVIGSGGGGVFCLASMCYRGIHGSDSNESGDGYFAAGCEDGTVKIYSAFGSGGRGTVSGMPELVATLPSAGDAILSLAWVPGQNGKDGGGMGGSVIFAGVADGTIRRFDCTTAVVTGPISTGTVLAPSRGSSSTSYRWKSTLRMTVENRGLRESTKVWVLEALSDGTVISGDSLGHVQMWDGLSGTMTQSFDHNESGADVLCLAVSEDENKIFASGVDSSVRCIQRQALPSKDEGDQNSQNVRYDSTPVRNWISSTSHRKHSHDVKALVICHKTSKNSNPVELLVSGSVDTRICTYIAKDFNSSRPKIWYNWPTLSPISSSRKERLLAVTRVNGIDLFRLKSPKMVHPLKNVSPEMRNETKCLVKTISIQSPFNLSCSVISDDGKFLAATDALSLYVFSLQVEDEDGVFDVHPTKLSLPWECKQPGTALRFDDRGRLICATSNGPINILQISASSETNLSDGAAYTVSLEHVFKEHMINWSASSHHFPVVCLDVSPDGKWLAAGRFSSGKGAVHVFTLPTSKDGHYRHWWSLPQMDASSTCIKFLGGGSVESSLAVGCSNNEFYIYNLGRRSLSHWSNDMGLPLLKSLPKELVSRSEPVARILSSPVTPQKFILGSHGYFCAVDLDQPVPERSSMFPPDHLRSKRLQFTKDDDASMYCPSSQKKSKSNLIHESNTNFTICLRYSEILFQDFIAENEMVIVEEPWMSILEELPDALARRVYGA